MTELIIKINSIAPKHFPWNISTFLLLFPLLQTCNFHWETYIFMSPWLPMQYIFQSCWYFLGNYSPLLWSPNFCNLTCELLLDQTDCISCLCSGRPFLILQGIHSSFNPKVCLSLTSLSWRFVLVGSRSLH